MKARFIVCLALLISASLALAEVKVVSERNEGPSASGPFKFKNIPSPSNKDAGAKSR